MSYISDVLSLFTSIYKLLLTFPVIGLSAIAGVLIYRFLLLKYPTLLQSLVTKAEAEIKALEGQSASSSSTASATTAPATTAQAAASAVTDTTATK